MDPRRFDRLTKLFSTRQTRRKALEAGGASVAAAGLVAGGWLPATAQDATPANPHPSADAASTLREFLFVQPFEAGAWAPKAGADGVYTLTLTGAAANTTYFSDRPDRITGLSPTQAFLDGLGFDPDNPPNAALVATPEGSNDQEVLVIELLDPLYDADAATLTYEARVLNDYGGTGLEHLARQQQDYELPESFGQGSLFIDSCSDVVESCFLFVANPDQSCTYEYVGNQTIGRCWNHETWACDPCYSDLSVACASNFPAQCGGNASCYDDLFLCGNAACCAGQGGCVC